MLTATFGAACSPSTTPPPEDATGAASFGPNDLAPGTHVQVNKNGQWLPATIAQPLGGDRFIVAYDGFGPQWNEAVGMDRIKAGAAAAPAAPLGGRHRRGDDDECQHGSERRELHDSASDGRLILVEAAGGRSPRAASGLVAPRSGESGGASAMWQWIVLSDVDAGWRGRDHRAAETRTG